MIFNSVFSSILNKLSGDINSDSFNLFHEALYSKMSGTTAKIALIIHTVKSVTGENSEKITKETMDSAIKISQYYLYHSSHVISLVSKEVTHRLSDPVYRWLIKKGQLTFIPSLISKYKVGGIKYVEEAKDALRQLINEHKLIYDWQKRN